MPLAVVLAVLTGSVSTAEGALVDSSTGIAHLGIIDGADGPLSKTFPVSDGRAGSASFIEVTFDLNRSYNSFSALTIETGSGFHIYGIAQPLSGASGFVSAWKAAEHGRNDVLTVAFGPVFANMTYGFSVFGDFGQCRRPDACNAFNVRFNGTVTPIPAALPLMLTALGGLGALSWMRRRSRQRDGSSGRPPRR